MSFGGSVCAPGHGEEGDATPWSVSTLLCCEQGQTVPYPTACSRVPVGAPAVTESPPSPLLSSWIPALHACLCCRFGARCP